MIHFICLHGVLGGFPICKGNLSLDITDCIFFSLHTHVRPHSAAYKTVSGVNGPLVILDHVKVSRVHLLQYCMFC